MRFLFVVKFRASKNGANSVSSYRTVANSPKAAAKRMRKKGRIVSVRKVKRLSS